MRARSLSGIGLPAPASAFEAPTFRRVLSPERLTDLEDCALYLSGQESDADIDDTVPLRLLADIKTVWPDGEAQLFTRDLLEGLRTLDSSLGVQEIPLTARKLARMLRSFGIKSWTVRRGAETNKGYQREALDSAFLRYLSEETSHWSQPA